MRMAPALHRLVEPDGHTRQSAVLALLHNAPAGPALVFTARPMSLKHHGGQISFPGGGEEDGDQDYAHTALRETREELGIPTQDIEILGALTPLYIAPSQNLVHPYVGWMPRLPPVHPDPIEVAAVITVPLRELLRPTTIGVHTWYREGHPLPAPCYRVNGVSIWGATAMMLSELLAVIKGLTTEEPDEAPPA